MGAYGAVGDKQLIANVASAIALGKQDKYVGFALAEAVGSGRKEAEHLSEGLPRGKGSRSYGFYQHMGREFRVDHIDVGSSAVA